MHIAEFDPNLNISTLVSNPDYCYATEISIDSWQPTGKNCSDYSEWAELLTTCPPKQLKSLHMGVEDWSLPHGNLGDVGAYIGKLPALITLGLHGSFKNSSPVKSKSLVQMSLACDPAKGIEETTAQFISTLQCPKLETIEAWGSHTGIPLQSPRLEHIMFSLATLDARWFEQLAKYIPLNRASSLCIDLDACIWPDQESEQRKIVDAILALPKHRKEAVLEIPYQAEPYLEELQAAAVGVEIKEF